MKRFVIVVVAARSLLAGTGVALLAAPPHDTSADGVCEVADGTQHKDFTCDYE